MRKILMAATALCCMTMTMIAEPVSPSAARQAAEKFLQGKGVALKSEAMRTPRRAMGGHKVDAIRSCDKASFCVIDQDCVRPAEYTTYFRSVIAFGRIRIVEDEGEKLAIARILGNRYNPNQEEALQKELEHGLDRMLAICLDIEHLTGKEAIEMVRQRAEK